MAQSEKGKVLVIDDERNITIVIEAILSKAGYSPVIFNDSSKARAAIRSEAPDVVLTDLYMPGMGGMDLLRHCQEHHPRLPVVIMTAYGTVESAVSALKRGAFDYVTKPFDRDELLNVVAKAVKTGRDSEGGSISIVGQSQLMKDVLRVVAKIAATPSTVLIQGESGTGKELVALEVHRSSDRKDGPFIKINCAAIPATLIESELFGYEKGAFTGAVTSKPGRFELASGGTLFLDEVAEMPLEMQAKLLRALQEQEFERVGGIETVKVDVRIVAATNKELEKEVREGRFREDLYYRLNVVPIKLPPLRDRREDIATLVGHFVEQIGRKVNKRIEGIEPEWVRALEAFDWPGNIRQLENAIERMVIMCEGKRLTAADLPPELRPAGATASPDGAKAGADQDLANFKEIVRRQTQNLERELIEKALDETGGNVTHAADRLGLSRKGLQLKLRELGIKRPTD